MVRAKSLVQGSSQQEAVARIAEGHVITILNEGGAIDSRVVHPGAIRGTEVFDGDVAVGLAPHDAGVVLRDGGIVDDDLAVGEAPDGHGLEVSNGWEGGDEQVVELEEQREASRISVVSDGSLGAEEKGALTRHFVRRALDEHEGAQLPIEGL